MKLLLLCLSTIYLLSLSSCASGRNEIMAQLLVSKKSLEDSVSLSQNSQSYYQQKAKDAMRDNKDTLVWHAFADSSTAAWTEERQLKTRLAAVNFSIDSLSKMK